MTITLPKTFTVGLYTFTINEVRPSIVDGKPMILMWLSPQVKCGEQILEMHSWIDRYPDEILINCTEPDEEVVAS